MMPIWGRPYRDSKGYYVLKFSQAFAGYGTWCDGAVSGKSVQAEGGSVGGYVEFPAGTTWVDVRIGSSFIDFEQAAVNLSKEIPARSSFASVTKRVKKGMGGKAFQDRPGGGERRRPYDILYGVFPYLAVSSGVFGIWSLLQSV